MRSGKTKSATIQRHNYNLIPQGGCSSDWEEPVK